MISTDKKTWLGLVVLTTSLAASGITPPDKATEYAVITERNPFGLVDPPKPQPIDTKPEPPKEAEPPPNVDLTGFFHNGRKGKTVALFLVEQKQDGKPVKKSYMWAEGEGDDGMKVLAINEAEETVKLSVRGVESTITFSEPKVAAAAVPAAGRPNFKAPSVQRPPNNANRFAPQNQGARKFQNSRSGSFGRPRTTSSAVGGAVAPQSTANNGNTLRSIPARNMRVAVGSAANNGQPPAQTLTPDQQARLIEVNRLIQQQNGTDKLMPPLPPTQYTTPQDMQRIVVPPTPPGQ